MALGASILEVLIVGNSTQLSAALSKGAASAKTFESTVKRSGASAQSMLGKIVPLAATAAAAGIAVFAAKSFQAAQEFDKAFTQIAALTNTTDARLAGMKDSVIALAGETAQSPVDLAKAMYFLASAGLDATQQMETLEASAKASASGLGEAGDIARITANALNVFADNGLKAADVTDTLVAAVREGSAEPDEFADALGRVLPIADAAGITFQQVAASLATMSNAGLDVNEGVTALRGTLQALVAPTTQTQDALDDMGLSVDDVVNSLQRDGLIATLRMLSDEAKKNTDSTGEYNIAMRNLVPNVRALTGVMNLTGQEAAKVDKIFRQVSDSTGDAAAAFQTTAESDAFQLKQALNEISIEGQQLAADVLPAVAGGLGLVADHAKGLMQILGGLAALKIGARLTSNIEATTGAMGALGRASTFVKGNLGPLSIVLASIGAAFTVVKGAIDDAHTDFQALSKDTKLSAHLLAFLSEKISFAGTGLDLLHGNVDDFMHKSLSGFVAGLNGAGDQLQEVAEKAQPLVTQMHELGFGVNTTSNLLGQFSSEVDGSSESIDFMVGQTQKAVDAISYQVEAFGKGKIGLEEFQHVLEHYQISAEESFLIASRAADSHGRKLLHTGETIRNFLGMTSDEMDTWATDVSDSFREVTKVSDVTQGNFAEDLHKMAEAARLMNQDMKKLANADWVPDQFLKFLVEQGPAAVHDFANANRSEQGRMVGDWKAYEKAFGGTMDALTRAIKNLTDAINGVPKTHNTNFHTNAEAARNSVQNLGSDITALDNSVVIDIKTHIHPGSPWPDEALKAHLFDPMKRGGFKKIGEAWTLPLDVAAHSTLPIDLPDGGGSSRPGGNIGRLIQIEVDSRGLLKDIRQVLKQMDAIKGYKADGGGSSGGSTGATGGVGRRPGDAMSALTDAVRRIIKLTEDSGATVKEGIGVVKRVMEEGSDAAFIKKAVASVRDEMGNDAAKLYARALRRLDDATLHSDAKRAALIKQALEVMATTKKAGRDPDELAPWQVTSMRNLPRLPEGHTRIDPNRHQPIRLRLDRKHFDEEQSYFETYRGYG